MQQQGEVQQGEEEEWFHNEEQLRLLPPLAEVRLLLAAVQLPLPV